MGNEDKKPRLQINLGGLVVIIILALVLFKVDIKSKIESEQFQKNTIYITEKVKDFWEKYVTNPLKSKTGGLVKDFTGKIQKSANEQAQSLIKKNFFDNKLEDSLQGE